VFGVNVGSMARCERRSKGVECEMVGVMRLCRIVGMRRGGGMI
jgi:hypothetical protein